MAMRSKIWTRRLWRSSILLLLLSGVMWNATFLRCEAAEEPVSTNTTEVSVSILGDKPVLGDLNPKGNCSEDIQTFCSKTAGTALDCISKELKNERAGQLHESGKTVSEGCKQEWRTLKISLYKDLSLDKKIEVACKSDIEKTCSDDEDMVQGVLACLRGAKDELSQPCQDEVFRAEEDAVNDFKMDPLLSQRCSEDADTYCKGIKPGEGRVQTCLRDNIRNISYSCHAELFRQEVENAGDLRLNVALYNACLDDKMKFCPTVHPGKSRLKDCLESNRLEPGFSKSCTKEFDKMLARRSSDFRLNPALKDKCKSDITKLCDEASGDSSGVPAEEEPKIIHCLQDFKDELQNTECKDEVHKLLALAAEDYRFDKEFSDQCEASKVKLCKDVSNDKVLSCLQGQREQLDTSCRAAVFNLEWRLSGDIDFKFGMKQSCTVEMAKFCHGLRHDRGDVIECLQQRVDDEEMGADCKKEIVADQLETAKDYRLNYRIYKDCFGDVESLCNPPQYCTGYQPCGGVVLGCLQDKVDHLSSESCKKDVISFEIKESKNVELNIPLQKACQGDIQTLCRRKGRDHSNALACLRAQRSKLTKDCKDAELRFSMMEATDIRLTPSLMNACGAELNSFCSDASPTNGEAFKCLQMHLESINMGAPCKVQVDLQGARQASDYRLDVRVRTECKEDVDKLCSGLGKSEEGHAAVLKCFIDQYKNLTGGCQTEVAYATRMALWQYKLDSDLTSPCDASVKKMCNSSDVKPIEGVVIGSFGQCLATQRRRTLDPECRAIVRVATKNGIFNGNATDADLAATYLKVNELRGGEDLNHSGIGFFWVTTVVAFVAILAVALFRRYSGPPKTYTLVVKGGDL